MGQSLVELMRVLTPHVKVRLLFTRWPGYVERAAGQAPLSAAAAEARLAARLAAEGLDLGRIELLYTDTSYGAIQDPGPFFLRRPDGELALADFDFEHPDPAAEGIDRDLARRLRLPIVPSSLVSEGGARQSNGRGTLLLVESVEFDRNPGWTREAIEAEHLRVHGARKVVWLKHGPREEDWGRLEDGRWGIGTGGHVDEFARFADERTILLAEVPEGERDANPVQRATSARLEENFAILSGATDQDGRPFRIVRVPVPEQETRRVRYDDLGPIERFWFQGAQPGDEIEFYLPASYLNLIIANGVVVTARMWRPGLPKSVRERDEQARAALAAAFPGRQIVQLDARAMLHDGAGLHCWSRNQPIGRAAP